jgi:hypothetical protein
MTLSEEWAATIKNPDIHTIPPIPWQDTSFSATLAVPAVKISDPASAKAPALYAMLSDFKSRQLLTPGFRLFNLPERTSSTAVATQSLPVASPFIPSLPANEHSTGAAPSPHTALKENALQSPPDARSTPAQTPASTTPITQLSGTSAGEGSTPDLFPPSHDTSTLISETPTATTPPAEPPHAPNGMETGIPSASSKKSKKKASVSSKKSNKKKSNTTAPVPSILVVGASMPSGVTPMDESTKKGQKRRLEVTEETQKNAKRAKWYVKF